MTRMIAGKTPGWSTTEVWLDGTKLEMCIEADDVQGKAWVDDPSEYNGYKVLQGKVEFKKITPQDKPHSDTISVYGNGIYKYEACRNPDCQICNNSDGTTTLNIAADTIDIEGVQGYIDTYWSREIEAEWIEDQYIKWNDPRESTSQGKYTLGVEIKGTREFQYSWKPQYEEITGAMVDDIRYDFDAPVNLMVGDTLTFSVEVAGDGITINSVSIIRK